MQAFHLLAVVCRKLTETPIHHAHTHRAEKPLVLLTVKRLQIKLDGRC